MKKSLLLLSLILCFFFSVGQTEDFELGKIFVKSDSDSPMAIYEYDSTYTPTFYSTITDFDSIAVAAGIYKIERTFKILGPTSDILRNIFTVFFSENYSSDSLVSFLSRDSAIIYAEKIPFFNSFITPVDSLYDATTQWNLFKIDAEDAWDLTQGSNTVKVAVVDDAILLNHDDLKYKIWVNQGEIPSSLLSVITVNTPDDGIIDIDELLSHFSITDIDSLYFETTLFNGDDDDNNGYFDDILGWDATYLGDNNPNPPASASSTNFTHGTHVAGIVGAQTTESGNGNGVASIGWNISILPVKCKNDNTSGSSLQSTYKGAEYAIVANADVINMSFGAASYNSSFQDLMNEAHIKGIILVASAGNDGDDINLAQVKHYPAAYDNVISVGASNENDLRASFSCYSSNNDNWIDVMSPGTNIHSCLADGTNSYGNKDGTSMATPLVAGLLGLMKSYCPGCTPEQIEDCLYSTCDSMPNEPLYDPIPDSSKVGHGRINAYNAISCMIYDPIAEFSTYVEFICSESTIGLVDESIGYITSWLWSSPDSFVSFSSDTAQNPEITIAANTGTSFTITLIAYNDSATSSDTISHTYTVTQPEANISYPDTITENCDGNSNYFLVEFTNANLPCDITYIDNFGNSDTITNITQNPALINVFPVSDTITTYILTSLLSYSGCIGIVSDSATYISEICNCANTSINNHWTFGNQAAIQFEETINDNTIGAYELPQSCTFFSGEGCSSVSDINGDLLFFADVNKVYDKTYYQMQDGNFLGHYSSAQSNIILPKSIVDSTYYLVSVCAAESYYSNPQETIWLNLIDLTIPGDNGGSSSSPNGRVVLNNSVLNTEGIGVSEKLTWVKHGNLNNHYWVITHSNSGNQFLVYLLTPDTISLHHIDTTGCTLSNFGSNVGFLKANLQGHLLAAVYWGENTIELYDFNNNNGEISLLHTINVGSPFSVEFSPNSGYLYYTCNNNPNIFRYTIFNQYPFFDALHQIISGTTFNARGLQLTPDHQQLIIGRVQSNFISSINNPNFSNSTYINNAYSYTETPFLLAGFPQFVPSLQIELNIDNITDDCDNSCSGSATVSAISLCDSISFQWDDSLFQTGSTATGLCPGTYTVIATDSCGCTNSIEVTISSNSIFITNVEVPGVCTENNYGYVDISVDSTYLPITYIWSNGETTEDIYNLAQDNYSVTVTDGHGCEATANAEVFLNNIVINAFYQSPTCYNYANGYIGIAVTGGTFPYEYNWSNGETIDDLISLEAGLYTLVVTDASLCVDTFEVELVNPLPPDIVISTDSIISSCEGYPSGSIYLNIQGTSLSYLWSNNETSQNLVGFDSGDYYITVTDSSNCTVIDTFTVNQLVFPNYIIDFTDTICECSGSAFITPDSFQYNWSNGDTISNIDSLCSGSHFVTITNNDGCFMVDSINIIENFFNVQIVSTTPSNCDSSGTAWVSNNNIFGGTPPYTYQWNTSPIQTVDTAINLTAQSNYLLNIEDAEGCQDEIYFSIFDYGLLDIINPALTYINTSCPGVSNGSASIDTSLIGGASPYYYEWSGSSDTTFSVSGLSVGNYSVTVTDADSCIGIGAFSIEYNYIFDHTTNITNETCEGDDDGIIEVIVLSGTQDFIYELSGISSDTVPDTSYTYNNLSTGIYWITVTDNNGCSTVSDSLVINTEIYNLDFNVVIPECSPNLQGEIDLTVNGSYSPYNFLWNDSSTNEDYPLSIPSFGTYSVTVTDNNLCEITDTIIVEPNSTITLIFDPSHPTCDHINNGSLIVNPSGGISPYTYLWSNSEITQEITGLASDFYIVTVTDAYGCTEESGYVLNIGSYMSLNIDITNPNCNGSNTGGSIDLTITNGIPDYIVLWSTGETTEDISNLYTGGYWVTVTDSIGCDLYDSAIVGVPYLDVELNVTGQGCNGILDTSYYTNGQIETIITGGTVPFTYYWNTQQITNILTGLIDGDSYYVTIVDATGCSSSDSAIVASDQDISLPLGWSLWSTYIEPFGNPFINDFFDNNGLSSEISIMKNTDGDVYWPSFLLNDIQFFTVEEGYQIKMNTQQDFNIEGRLACPEDNVLNLVLGWQHISYLRTTLSSIAIQLDTLVAPIYTNGSLELAKDYNGNIFWPYYGVNYIGNMLPGDGYSLKMNEIRSFYYLQNDTIAGTKSYDTPEIKSFNNFTDSLYINTDNFMIVGIPETSWGFTPNIGDEIAAIGENNQIVGKAIFEGGFTGMVIYGDDYYTPDLVENLSVDESFSFQIWNSYTKAIRYVEIKKWEKGDGLFADEKISVAGIVDTEINIDSHAQELTIQIYPNPGSGLFIININSPVKGTGEINIYNNTGQLKYTLSDTNFNTGSNKIRIDLSDLSSGSYILKVICETFDGHKKLILIK